MSSEMDATASIIEHIYATRDVKEKAEIAGLMRAPFKDAEMDRACGTCIYFLPRHRHCDLPALDFPVDPDWWCQLWRL